jgi:protein SCO1/2
MRPRPKQWGTLAVVAVLLGLLPACASSSRAASDVDPSSVTDLVGKPAPDFSLQDQFDRPERLSEYRGSVVLLTFVSSRCKTICPLTAELLSHTQDLLGARSRDLRLIAVNADYVHTAVPYVLAWSKLHRMTHRWLFLTGASGTLMSVYRAYGITPGEQHTTVVFVIDGEGTVRAVVPVAMRKSLDAEAQVLARYVKKVESA